MDGSVARPRRNRALTPTLQNKCKQRFVATLRPPPARVKKKLTFRNDRLTSLMYKSEPLTMPEDMLHEGLDAIGRAIEVMVERHSFSLP